MHTRYGYLFVPLRALHPMVEASDWPLAGRAVQIVEWSRTHRFCGRCGNPTEQASGERAMRCPVCGLLSFPRLSPAVIMVVHRGDEVLLAHGRAFPSPMYSALAGFVEPGETIEDCVRREVKEEVGVEVGALTYFASQSWSFPHSLMIAYTAEYTGGELPKTVSSADFVAMSQLVGRSNATTRTWRARSCALSNSQSAVFNRDRRSTCSTSRVPHSRMSVRRSEWCL